MKSDQGFISLIKHLVTAEGGDENSRIKTEVTSLLTAALENEDLILLTRDEFKDMMTEAFKDGQRWKREHSLEGALIRTQAGIAAAGVAAADALQVAARLPAPAPMTGPGRRSPAFSPAYKKAAREALIRSDRRGRRRHR